MRGHRVGTLGTASGHPMIGLSTRLFEVREAVEAEDAGAEPGAEEGPGEVEGGAGELGTGLRGADRVRIG